MKILIAPDKFKDSLSAKDVCAAVNDGLADARVAAGIQAVPLADGGEGTCALLTEHANGTWHTVSTVDARLRSVQASYGISGDGSVAFIEMASASGLQLLKREEQDPLCTTTFGTGLMIRHAMEAGVKQVVLGIGGSATNDGGIGMASALGWKFFDEEDRPLEPVGKNLIAIRRIQRPAPSKEPIRLTVLCDVTNPLYGITGAAFVYAPQKGADDATVSLLDEGLKNLASIVRKEFNTELNFEGSGAGGGMAAGAFFFLNGEPCPGIDYVMNFVSLAEKIRQSDIVITGEGKLDRQSLSGKVVHGVSRLCREFDKPLIVVAGKVELSDAERRALGQPEILELVGPDITEQQAISDAYSLIRKRIAILFSIRT